MVGVSRRAWARNENAMPVVAEYNKMYEGKDHITLPYINEKDDEYIAEAMKALNM